MMRFIRRQRYLFSCYRGQGFLKAIWLYFRHGVCTGDFLY